MVTLNSAQLTFGTAIQNGNFHEIFLFDNMKMAYASAALAACFAHRAH